MRIILVLFCLSEYLFAASIEDPHQILKQFESQLEDKEFKEMHPCHLSSKVHQTVENYEISCDETGHFCTDIVITSDQVTSKNVRNCSANSLQVLTSNGDIEFYFEEDFIDQNKNYVSRFLSQVDELLGYRVNIKLNTWKKAKMTLGHLSGNRRKVNVYNIFGTIIFQDMNLKRDFILTTSSQIPAPLQVMRFRVSGSNLLRLLDYKKDLK
ncbi:MAG: hypothetical protein QF441_13105 [Bacteriovoracaceae bacterium]|jgi:hypothetical protein|nr:hypothetical protein [Halobacteriovoraceae bacterium]MDP7321543.1 hypothetical protein [Bacteriovoracaceae bacterium]|tara:strand:+ start:100 stop:732 length:633 start_codon:yes stop_codon:yes gene_type:complete